MMNENKIRLLFLLLTNVVAASFINSAKAYSTPNTASNTAWKWSCSTIQKTDLYKNKIIWQTLNCDGYVDNKKILQNLNINIVSAPANDSEIKFIPYQAQTPNQLAKLPEIASNIPEKYNVIAGINGGYFFRNDVAKFKDNICFYKTFHPPKPNESMGDSLLQHDGNSYATNCAFWPGTAQNPRAALILTGINPDTNKNAPYITLVKPDIIYKQSADIPDAIGAGPNLVTNGKLTVNNPDENLLPTLEFSANSAVGIMNDASGNPSQLIFFTVDGNDDSFKKGWPGMNALEMGDFMLNYLRVSNAISMDQGGSTTLYVASSDAATYPMHVVSNSNFEPGVPRTENKIRNIYDGLFIAIPKTK